MKPTSSLLLLGLSCTGIAHGQILLGGYHGLNETALQSPSATGVAVTLARTGPSNDITQGTSQISSALWGTAALDVPSPSTSDGSKAIVQTATVDASDVFMPFTLVLTVTNNGSSTLLLDQLHFIVKKDVANAGPNAGTLTYTSGDLSEVPGTAIPFAIPNGVNGIDIALAGGFADTTLAVGETATLTWAHGEPESPSGNTSLRLDNFAISGTFFTDGGDTTAPSPDPMTWDSPPAATGESSITMTATTATDTNGVEYYFTETSGNPGGSNSGWQTSPTYTDTGLSAATTYSYTVMARDLTAAQNTTTASSPVAQATTDAADTDAPTPNPMTFAVPPNTDTIDSISMTATTASDINGVEYYFTETSGNPGGSDSGWQDSPDYTDDGLDPDTTYSYTVMARDKSNGQNATTASDPAAATTLTVFDLPQLLLGGFDGTNEVNAPKQHVGIVGSFAMELSTTSTPFGGFNPGGMQSSYATWGNAVLDPPADSGSDIAVVRIGVPLDLAIVVTNTSATYDITLDSLHWVSKRDTNDGPTTATITYTGGDLADTPGTGGDYLLGGLGGIKHDYPLSTILTDRVLAPGESATFHWVTSGENAAGNDGLRVDNIAISGSVSSSDFIAWSMEQSWTVGDPGTGSGDDYDGDGLTNEQERLFALDPTNPASKNPITTPFDPATGTFSYSRRLPSLTGLDYPVYFSVDLQEWFRDAEASQTSSSSQTVATEIVSMELNPALLGEPQLFIRVSAEPELVLPAPELVATFGSGDTVTLLFSEDLYIVDATDPANYTVELDGGGSIAVSQAMLSEDNRSVILKLAAPLGTTSTYNVNFSNLSGSTGVAVTGSSSGQFTTWDNDPTGIKVFILAGQSNMVGYGHSETGNGGVVGAIGSLRYLATNNATYPEYDYTSLLTNPADPANSTWASRGDVKVWWHDGASGNLGGTVRKGDLDPSQGATNGSDDWFGPEYGFGQVIGNHYASDDVLIIKTAWGGHNLVSQFRPPSAVAKRGGTIGASYQEMVANVHEVLDNLGTEFPEWSGKGYQIVGFAWHQGTSDKSPVSAADEYKDNLPDLIADVRAEFGNPDLPFVIATTGMSNVGPAEPYPYSSYHAVEKAQLWVAGVAQPANVLTADTRPFWEIADESPRDQGFHWNQNARSYFRVGKALGDDMVTLLSAP